MSRKDPNLMDVGQFPTARIELDTTGEEMIVTVEKVRIDTKKILVSHPDYNDWEIDHDQVLESGEFEVTSYA